MMLAAVAALGVGLLVILRVWVQVGGRPSYGPAPILRHGYL